MKIRHLLIIILSLFLWCCTSESGSKLELADSVMEEHPDSAMSLLMGINRCDLKNSELPYYALLYTQAQVKTDVALDSDSLISIAYAKYGSATRGDRGIRSNFYTGEVFFNQEKYPEAMGYYLTAYEESKRLSDDYWLAKSAERISDIFFIAYNYDEAERYAKEAAALFKQVDRQINHKYMLGALSNIWLNNGESHKAYRLLDSLRNLSLREQPADSAFLEYINLPWMNAMVENGDAEEIVLEDGNLYRDDLSDKQVIDRVLFQSQVSNLMDNPGEAKEILNEVGAYAHSDEDMIHILYARYENAKADGDTSLAISLVDSMLYYQNKVAVDIIKESVMESQRDFYSQMSAIHESKSYFLKCLLVIAIMVFLLLISVGIVFVSLRNRAQKAKFQANLEAFLSLKASSDRLLIEKNTLERLVKKIGYKNDAMISQMQALQQEKHQLEIDHTVIVEKLFKEKWSTLDSLCDQYFGLNNSELNARDLISNMEKELKKIVSKKGLTDIVCSVDIYMGGIVTKLREQCPFLKDDDVRFIALLYAGFSVRAVCMFTGIKYPHFYVKKSRLIKRIQASDAPDKELFLEKIK